MNNQRASTTGQATRVSKPGSPTQDEPLQYQPKEVHHFEMPLAIDIVTDSFQAPNSHRQWQQRKISLVNSEKQIYSPV